MDDVKIRVIDSDKLVNAINEGSYDVNLSAVIALGAVMLDTKKQEVCEYCHTDSVISRQAAIDAVIAWTVEDRPDVEMPTDLIDRINFLPSVQPEIVRCRDCIAYQEGIDIDGKPFTRCNGINGSVRTYGHTPPDWYCADAERRTAVLDASEE